MNLAAKVTASFLESQGLKYNIMGDDGEVLKIGFNGDVKESVEVLLFFGNEGHDVALRSFNLCKVPEEKKPAIYNLCSSLNKEYRWVKFYLDEDDSTLTVGDDAVIQLDSCGEESLELILRMIKIIDDAYPQIMKILWN